MRIWIDAEPAAASPTIFGMSPIDRILRSLAKLPKKPKEIVVSCSGKVPDGDGYRVIEESVSAGKRLADYLASSDETVLVIDGGAVVDHRLVPLLMNDDDSAVLKNGAGKKETAILRLEPSSSIPDQAETVPAVAKQMIDAGGLREIDADDLPNFVVNLRRNVPFTLERIEDECDLH